MHWYIQVHIRNYMHWYIQVHTIDYIHRYVEVYTRNYIHWYIEVYTRNHIHWYIQVYTVLLIIYTGIFSSYCTYIFRRCFQRRTHVMHAWLIWKTFFLCSKWTSLFSCAVNKSKYMLWAQFLLTMRNEFYLHPHLSC